MVLPLVSVVVAVGFLLALLLVIPPTEQGPYSLVELVAYGLMAGALIVLSLFRLAEWTGIEKGFRWWAVLALLLETTDMALETIWYGGPTAPYLSGALLTYPVVVLFAVRRWPRATLPSSSSSAEEKG